MKQGAFAKCYTRCCQLTGSVAVSNDASLPEYMLRVHILQLLLGRRACLGLPQAISLTIVAAQTVRGQTVTETNTLRSVRNGPGERDSRCCDQTADIAPCDLWAPCSL